MAGLLEKGSPKVSVLGAAAGAVIDGVSATRDERGYMSDIADEYRPEIAERLGLAENQVTQQHYQMAFGENPVLAQAHEVEKMSGVVRAATATISVAAGTLAGLAASAFSRPKPIAGVDMKGKDPSNIAGGVVSTLAAAASGKLARKLLHTSRLKGAMEKTAHHKIMLIKEKQQRGEETTPADIFAVQLALNPELEQQITQVTKKKFADMQPQEQEALLQQEFPDILQANRKMADSINHDGMRPQQLVFGEVRSPAKEEPIAPGHPDLPPNAELPVEPVAVEASGAKEAAQALEARRAQEQPEQPFEHYLPETTMPQSHAERFAPEGAKGAQESFASRVEAARQAQAAEAAVQR